MNNFQLLNVLDATNFSTLLIILFQIKIAQNLIIDIHYSLMKNNPDLCTNDKFLLHFQKYFVDEKPVWSEEKGRVHVDKSIAQYTGGLVTIPKDLSDGLGVGMPELAHLVIGLESVSHQHKDFIPFCVSSPLYFHNFFSLNLDKFCNRFNVLFTGFEYAHGRWRIILSRRARQGHVHPIIYKCFESVSLDVLSGCL